MLFKENSLKTEVNYYDLNSHFEVYKDAATLKKLYRLNHLRNEGNQIAADKMFDYLVSAGLLSEGSKRQLKSAE